MPAAVQQRPDRYATAISLPRDQAKHVAKRARSMGVSSAAYIRLLIAKDMGITIENTDTAKA